jgi:DNA-binding transcriptional regulator YhcF (GntR family)
MEFNEHKPIYLQISDSICEKVLTEEWSAEERIPSVRELGSNLGVNPNTVMRTYEHLENLEIITNKRGVGFFVASNARKRIIKIQRDQFLNEELPLILKKMTLLEINPSEIFNI